MPTVTGAWDEDRTREFLRETAVPLRVACRRPGGDLWMLSLWFRYADGALHCATGADADVVRYLRADPGVAFEISTNEPPYRGVRGNGTAALEPDDDKEVLEDLLVRYLGSTDSDLARRLLNPEREEVHVRIIPERLHTWDYSDRMPGRE